MLAKTHKSHKEEQNRRHNAPQGTFGVIGHQVKVATIIQGQPDEHNKAGQWHHSNQASQRGCLVPYPSAGNNNAQTNQ